MNYNAFKFCLYLVAKAQFIILFVGLMGLQQASIAETVSVYTWTNYFAPNLPELFHKKTGHDLKFEYFQNANDRDKRIILGEKNIDLTVLGVLTLRIMERLGKITDLSSVEFSNKKHINKRWQAYCGDYGVAYAWGTIGIAYRSDVATKPPLSWTQFFNPEPAHHGRITYSIKTGVSQVSVGLYSLGLTPTTANKSDLSAVEDLMRKQAPYVLAYQHGVEYAKVHGPASNMSMTLAYSADIDAIKNYTGQKDWEFSLPEDGTLIWVDCLVNPSHKPLSAAAVEFLDFINNPKIAAFNAQSAWYATANYAALKHAREDYINDSMLFPSKSLIKKSKFFSDIDTVNYAALRAVSKKIHDENVDKVLE